MKKIILIILLIGSVITTYAQKYKTYLEMPSKSNAFGQRVPKNTLIFYTAEQSMYLTLQNAIPTDNLDSITYASFPKLLEDSVAAYYKDTIYVEYGCNLNFSSGWSGLKDTIKIDTCYLWTSIKQTIVDSIRYRCDTASHKVIEPCNDTLVINGNLSVNKRLNVDSTITLADTVIIKRFGESSYSFGDASKVLSNYSYNFGHNNNTISNFGYCIGHTNIKISDALILGSLNDSITSSFLLGGTNENITTSTICGYNNSYITGSYILGLNNIANTDVFILGYTNHDNDASTIVGKYNNNMLDNSYAIGDNNTYINTYGYNFGLSNNNISTNSFVIGQSNDSIYNHSVVIGELNDTINNYSFVYGIGNSKIKDYSFVIGSTNKRIEKENCVFGQFNQDIDTSSVIIGNANTVIKRGYVFGKFSDNISNGYAIGENLDNIIDTLFVIGKYNVDVTDSTDKRAFVFAYGGGEGTRKNLAEFLKSGTLLINHSGIETNGISKLRTDTLFIDSVNYTVTATRSQWIYVKSGDDNDTITVPAASKSIAGMELIITKDNAKTGDTVILYESSDISLAAIDDYAILRCNGYRWILYENKITP